MIMNTPISPYSGKKQSPISRWKCVSCNNYNLLKWDKCPKCNTSKHSMGFDLIKPSLSRADFVKKSEYLTSKEQIWRKQIIKSKTINIMREESNKTKCLSLKQCPCAKRAVFIQNLYRDWCRAHNSLKTIFDNDTMSNSSSSSICSTASSPRKKNKKSKRSKKKNKIHSSDTNDIDNINGNNNNSNTSSSSNDETPTTTKKRKKKKKKKDDHLSINGMNGGTPGHRSIKSTPLTNETLKNGSHSKKRRKKKGNNDRTKQKRKGTEPPKLSTTLLGQNKSSETAIKKESVLPPTTIKKLPKPSMSIADIIQKVLKHYNLQQLMEDCNHIDNIHCNDAINSNNDINGGNKYLAIFRFFQSESGICNDCNIFSRSNRNRLNDGDKSTRKRLYYGFINAKDVAIITTLDTYHSFWFHSLKLYELDAEKSYKALRSLDDDYYIDGDDYKSSDIPLNIPLSPLVDDNKINDDEKEKTNLNSSKFVTTIKIEDEEENKETKNLANFEFGEHFEYWQEYEKYDNFIPAKYKDLREELLNNKISCIPKTVYDDICEKCNLLMKTTIIKKMKAMKNFYNDIAKITEGEIITKHHLISIMIYTNHSEIQRRYKETLRLPTNIKLNDNLNNKNIDSKEDIINNDIYQEKYMELKEKNGEIANWCRLLFESVRFWGTIMTEKDFFFHGIDRTLLFDKFYGSFKSPISTSTQISVAQSFKDNQEGIIIKVSCSSEKSMIPFLDVSFISDFRMESERLFYGADLNIIDIYYKKMRFDFMLRALSLFQYIVSGGYFTHNSKLINDKNQKRLISLIENYLKYHDKQQLIYPKPKKKKKDKKKKNKDKDTDNDNDKNKDKKLTKEDKKRKDRKRKKNDKPPLIRHQPSQSDILLQVNASKRQKERKKKRKQVMDDVKINIRDDSQIKTTKKLKSKSQQTQTQKPSGHGPPARPLSKVKSNSDVHGVNKIKRKRQPTLPYKTSEIMIAPPPTNPNNNNNDNNKDNDDEKKEKKKRKYHHELFDFCVSSRQNSDIWLCRSEIQGDKILKTLQKYFISIKEDDGGGNFVNFWKEKWNVNIKYSQEFEWPIMKKNLDTFMNLPSGDLIQSQRYLYALINNESLSDIQFYAECCRWSKDDPGWTDFYWNVEKLPKGVSEIQVTLDVYCQEQQSSSSTSSSNNNNKNNRMISHDIYEGEWMSISEEENSYFGGKAFELIKEFYYEKDIKKNSDIMERRISKPLTQILGKPKISSFIWKMSVRVSTIAYNPTQIQMIYDT